MADPAPHLNRAGLDEGMTDATFYSAVRRV